MCHVLIIEDEWLIAEHLTDLALEAGATSIAMAASEHAAVREAHIHKPGVILSDVKLLTGTGPQAVQTITAQAGPIPVIFITGTPENCEPCDPPGIIFTKPFDAKQVVLTLESLMPA